MLLSTLTCRTTCCHCDQLISREIDFSWGAIPSVYEIGDKIQWFRDTAGVPIQPFLYFDETTARYNFGEPALEDLILFDERLFSVVRGEPCPICRREIGAIGFRVSNQKIHESKAFSEEELSQVFNDDFDRCSILEVQRNSTLVPRFDLENLRIQTDFKLMKGEIDKY